MLCGSGLNVAGFNSVSFCSSVFSVLCTVWKGDAGLNGVELVPVIEPVLLPIPVESAAFVPANGLLVPPTLLEKGLVLAGFAAKALVVPPGLVPANGLDAGLDAKAPDIDEGEAAFPAVAKGLPSALGGLEKGPEEEAGFDDDEKGEVVPVFAPKALVEVYV